MKDKDNFADLLSKILKGSLADLALLDAFEKLSGVHLVLHHRNHSRLLDSIVAVGSSDAKSSDVRKAAVSFGLSLIKSDLSEGEVVGSSFTFLEMCRNIALSNLKKDHKTVCIPFVAKTLEALSAANVLNLQKLFKESQGRDFADLVCFALKLSDLQSCALLLLDHGLSVPSSEALGKSISDHMTEFIEVTFPFLFDSNQVLRKAALLAMKKMKFDVKPASWKKMKQTTADKYCVDMKQMVSKTEKDWPDIWCFVVDLFGEELLSGALLINKMLGVIECGYKHPDLEWSRVQAFHCWKTLIYNFKTGFSNKKRMDLILIPLRAANHRTQSLASAKLNTYAYLLKTFEQIPGKDPDVVTYFLAFSFGLQSDTYPPVKFYPALHQQLADTFLLVLSCCRDQDLFAKVHQVVITATGEIILLKGSDLNYVTKVWHTLLGLVKVNEGPTQYYKNLVMGLFDLFKWFVQQTKAMEENAATAYLHSNQRCDLGALVAFPLLHNLVLGDVALKRSLFTNATFYSEPSDVMEGTPALQIIEWLLIPCVVLGSKDNNKHLELMSEMIEAGNESPAGFIIFVQMALKKMQLSAEKALSYSSEQKVISILGSLMKVWTKLAELVVNYMSKGGEINQGNAAQHDFRCIYSVLLYPVQHLYLHPECVTQCPSAWRHLYEEAVKQAALVATAGEDEFSEQLTKQLASVALRSGTSKQTEVVYKLISCVLRVESGDGLKSSKKWERTQEHVSSILVELMKTGLSKEEVFLEAAVCLCCCLCPPTPNLPAFEKASLVLHAMLKEKFFTFEPVSKMYEVFKALNEMISFMRRHSKGSSKRLSKALHDVITAGQTHASQKLRGATLELRAALEGKKDSVESIDSRSLTAGHWCNGLSGSVLHPLSASNSSPRRSAPGTGIGLAKTELPATVSPPTPGTKFSKASSKTALPLLSPSKFVRIEAPPKKIVLTEHQKEVRKERRQDIPALYQDLTQDTQSMSQESGQGVIALSETPAKFKATMMDVEDHAVMDVMDVDQSVTRLPAEKPCVPISPMSVAHSSKVMESSTSLKSFTPPSGFVLQSPSDVSKSIIRTENSVKELGSCKVSEKTHLNANGEKLSIKALSNKPNRRKSATPVKKGKTVTRNSISERETTTRSGKVLKRLSLVTEPTLKTMKRKYRKSLPTSSSSPSYCDSTTDTESISSDSSFQKATKWKPKKWKCEKDQSDSLTNDNSSRKDENVEHSSPKREITKVDEEGKVDEPKVQNSPGKQSNLISDKERVVVENVTVKKSSSNRYLNHVAAENHSKPGTPPKRSPVLAADQQYSEISDSQDIIESSQEPQAGVTKACAVSLEAFRDTEPNGKLSIADIVLVKGPDSGSPYKVITGHQSRPCLHSSARRALTLDGPSPSSDWVLKVSETGTPVPNAGNEDSPPKELSSPPKQRSSTLQNPSSPPNVRHPPPLVEHTSPPKRQNSPSTEVSTVLVANSDPNPTLATNGHSDDKPEIVPFDGTSPVKIPIRKQGRRLDTSFVEDTVSSPPKSAEVTARSDSLPDVTYDKKTSPLGKPLRHFRCSARSQAFMRAIPESESANSPPKPSDEAQTASPVQVRKACKSGADTHSSPINLRSGRAAQLLGLGQAAAVRGGDRVLCAWSDRAEDSDDTVPASPSVRRKGRLFLKPEVESPKASPSLALKDEGAQEAWVPKTPLGQDTTPSGILKRKHDADGEVQSPNIKRKRVSFRDPPLSTFLSFNIECNTPGTLFTSDHENGIKEKMKETGEDADLSEIPDIQCDVEVLQNGDVKQAGSDIEDVKKCETSVVLELEVRKEDCKGIDSRETNEEQQAGEPLKEGPWDVDGKAKKRNTKEKKSDRKRLSIQQKDTLQTLDSYISLKKVSVACTTESIEIKDLAEEKKHHRRGKRSGKLSTTTSAVALKDSIPVVEDLELQKLSIRIRGISAETKSMDGSDERLIEQSEKKPQSEVDSEIIPENDVEISRTKEKISESTKCEANNTHDGTLDENEITPGKGVIVYLNEQNLPSKVGVVRSPKKRNSSGRKDEVHSPKEGNLSRENLRQPVYESTQKESIFFPQVPSFNSEEENDTQGKLDDLVCNVLWSSDPIYPRLVGCSHPIDCIIPQLTSAAWRNSLLRELAQKSIQTVGCLSSLSEEKINRLAIRSPKKDFICRILQDFENSHSQTPYYFATCGLTKDTTSPLIKSTSMVKALLAEIPVKKIAETLAAHDNGSDLCKSLPTESLLQELTERLGVDGVQTELNKIDRDTVLRTVVSEASVDAVLDYLLPENVGAAVSLRDPVMRSLQPDSVAETYMSQIQNTSGKVEYGLSVDQLSSILSKINPETVRELICPKEISKRGVVPGNVLLAHVLKNNVDSISDNSLNIMRKIVFKKTDVNVLSEHIIEEIKCGKMSEGHVDLLMQSIIPHLKEKKILRMLCEAGLKLC